MLSRVADSIYWLGRYIERAENVARLIWVNLNLSLDLRLGADQQWMPMIVTTGDEAPFLERYGTPTRRNVIQFLTFDLDNPNSILSCLHAARHNARAIREVISSEMWETVNRFYLALRSAGGVDQVVSEPQDLFNDVRSFGQTFVGVTDATMTQGEAWHFCRLGRLIERAGQTARILDVKYYILLPAPEDVGTPYDQIQWTALLRSASAYEMYRQRHGRLVPARVVDFLILDREFPRAVLFCLTQAQQSLHAVSGQPVGYFTNPAEQRLGQLRAALAYARADDIIARGLHEFVDDLEQRLNHVGDAIFDTFFNLRPIEVATG